MQSPLAGCGWLSNQLLTYSIENIGNSQLNQNIMNDKFYITTPIYYANAAPHIGHAYTTVAADTAARFSRLEGKKTFMLTGMDEHGAKIQEKADSEGKTPQELVNSVADDFRSLWSELGIDYDNFIRTTDVAHKETVQKTLQHLYDEGMIYKGEYEGLYCVGCEQYLNESDLIDGKCPDHDREPEVMSEESYMLKMGEKQKELIEKIESNEIEIVPERYKNEILSFLKEQKLKDLSISRKNVSWGIALPFDESHTAYVWFDAFLNYLTGLGWNGNPQNTPGFWPADTHLIGKDILRVHATIWPIMLMHLGIELPKKIFTHGHILSGGKKMSKTLGNVIGIDEMMAQFGKDGTRYLLLSAGTFSEDVDLTMERMTEKYNNDLANGLGNLVSRVVKLSEDLDLNESIREAIEEPAKVRQQCKTDVLRDTMEKMEFSKSLESIWGIVRDSNKKIEDTKPWELKKTDQDKFEAVMGGLILDLFRVSQLLIPFIPETAEKIKKALETKERVILFERIK
ncbi:MAG: methionine--tRNA ligase [Candidatus Moranbacteria bacterium]|nr:methionine--tRNA ligase [Candidatus Moranbacteria bacterium]